MYEILVSRTFEKQFKTLSKQLQNRVKKALLKLEDDPLKPRSGLNIKSLVNTKPQKHRLRIGEYRIVYLVEKKTVKVIEIFLRGREYRK